MPASALDSHETRIFQLDWHGLLEQRASLLLQELFGAPAPLLELRAGDVLLQENSHNTRLFLVTRGALRGYSGTGEGATDHVLARAGDLVGVQSFCSGLFISPMTIVALEDTGLRYLDAKELSKGEFTQLQGRLMPLVVHELVRRQGMLHELALKEQHAQEQLREMDRITYLGKLAAGVAHELNNALTVIDRGGEWISTAVAELVEARSALDRELFNLGFLRGRVVSSGGARDQARQLRIQHGLGVAESLQLAQIAWPEVRLPELLRQQKELPRLVRRWELGATLHDLRLAAEHARHVVVSMMQLGVRDALHAEPVDVNQSIGVALSILRNVCKGIQVHVDEGELPRLLGNPGEFVQIWQNLISNACDALHGQDAERRKHRPPEVRIRTWVEPPPACGKHPTVAVRVEDNGPGIPPALLPHIFEPNVTTKQQGLSFGLGLGLTIVQRLVHAYHGTIQVHSSPAGAAFEVRFPVADAAPDPGEPDVAALRGGTPPAAEEA